MKTLWHITYNSTYLFNFTVTAQTGNIQDVWVQSRVEIYYDSN